MPTTNASPRYYRINFININSISREKSGATLLEKHLDFLSQRYIDVVKSIRNVTPYIYASDDLITTVSYRFYKTTSLWWLILMFNGLSHPMEIEAGSILKIPALQDIIFFLGKTQVPKGQRITI